MPYTMNFENNGAGVVVTLEGVITGKEIVDANKFIYAHDKHHQLRYQIWDFSKTDRIQFSDNEIRTFAIQDKIAADKNPNQIVAIIGTNDFFKGADRRYAIYAEVWAGFKSDTFDTISEAREWLASVLPDN